MPRILCAGMAVLDEVFHVHEFPLPDTKAEATGFIAIGGGNAANAAVAIARLGGEIAFAGPIGGPAGEDAVGDRVLKSLAAEGIDCSGFVRLDGASTPISAILLNAHGERTIANHRDKRLDDVTPADPDGLVAGFDVLLIDNRYPRFVMPICEAARRRGLAVVIDADKATAEDDPLFAVGTHVIFSGDCLRRTTGIDDLASALARIARYTDAFLATTNGPMPVLWREDQAIREMPVYEVAAVDTLAAGDVFHGAFTLAFAEGRDIAEAMRFASAAAGLKCTRFGGAAGAPDRREVEALLAADRR